MNLLTIKRLCLWVIFAGFTAACSLTTAPSPDTITIPATTEPVANDIPTPTPAPLPSELMWTSSSHEGLSWREVIPNGNFLARMVAVRIDPAQFAFRVHYSPGEPRTLARWREALPDAVAIINANFFTPEFYALGLVVSEGQVYGTSYVGRGGTFAVQNGAPLLRSNVTTPYQGEAFEHAAQAFPMLVENGEQAYTRTSDTQGSRRSIIAQDSDGNFILMTAPLLGFGLYDLSEYLANSDELKLVTALNLDGGGSSMLYADVSTDETLDIDLGSFDPVPAVIAVYAK